MQQTIKNTTANLLASLPQEHVYYTPSDFKKAGFPEYLIHRIQLEVDRNLADSVSLPDSEWIDMKAENVLDSWEQFLSAIKAESRVPASYAQSVIESAVEDVIDQLTQPRNYILDTLIGEKSATLYQIQSRKDWVVCYPILAEALIRYMQRKELESISREKALQVISHVDEKIAENYTPLKWAQHLDPLFSLLNNDVPSALFVRFFNDREMTDFAKWVDKGPDFLSRTSFIERISTVGMLPEQDVDDFEVDSGSVSAESTESTNDTTAEFPPEASMHEEHPVEADDTTSEENFDEGMELGELNSIESPPFDTNDATDTSSNEELPNEVTLDEVLEEEAVSDQPLFAQFLSNEDETGSDNENTHFEAFSSFEPETESESEPQADFVPELDSESETESETELDSEPENEPEDFEPKVLESESPNAEPKELSIAESFNMGQSEPSISDRLSDTFEEAGPVEDVQEEEIDEPEDTPPIIDASSDDEHVIYLTDRAKRLLDLLEPNFEAFVVEIFLNDELDFYKHLENIVAYDQWRSAGRYITRDIFDRNRIDLYSENAVMFTDAVQEFFDQNA